MKQFLNLCLLLFFLFSISAFGQPYGDGLIEYEFGYPFKTGIYYTFENFKENRPIEINSFRVIRRANTAACRTGKLSDYIIYESGSEELRVNGEDIWGYSKKGDVYVSHKNMFYEILIYGGISYMVALRGGFKEDDGVQKQLNAANEERHALLDANTGKTYDFKTKFLDSLLMQDKEIYEEYLNSNLKKRDKKFIFLRKYNEKHQIYFPIVED